MKTSWLSIFLVLLVLSWEWAPARAPLWAKPHHSKEGDHRRNEPGEGRWHHRDFWRPGFREDTRFQPSPHEGFRSRDHGRFRYLYYPDAQVYFCPESGRYFWLTDGVWMDSSFPPDQVPVGLLPAIDLELDAAVPYADHPWVSETYPGNPGGVLFPDRPGNGPPRFAPAWGHGGRFRYHYYPRVNIYHNLDTNRYFWIEGNHWRIGIQVPSGVILDDRDRTSLALASPYPF